MPPDIKDAIVKISPRGKIYVDDGNCAYILWDGVLPATDDAGGYRNSLKYCKIMRTLPWLGENGRFH
jgi:hypothetical protein